jgi:hypothetical protein
MRDAAVFVSLSSHWTIELGQRKQTQLTDRAFRGEMSVACSLAIRSFAFGLVAQLVRARA